MPAEDKTPAPLAVPPSPAAEPETTGTPPATQPAGPLKGPKYNTLRFDDDFSYLDGPEGSYKPDFFDPIKRIRVGDDLTIRLGGEIRGRMEAVTHKNYGRNQGRFGGAVPTQDTFFIHRYIYHANIEYQKLARVFVEGINAFAEDLDGTPVAPSQDRFDAQQFFMDLRILGQDTPLTLRFGRQELLYGRERLVSSLDWANVPRTWDALKLFWSDETWNLDAFYARLVEVRNHRPNRYDEDIHFYGLYGTYKGIPNHGIDAYLLALRNEGRYTNANYTTGDIGDLSLYTLGTRFWGKTPVGRGTWDYESELAGQWGKAAGDTVQAWMWSALTGYTFDKAPMKPRIGMGIDYASGDDDPYDDIHGTFNQLFPLGHAYLGYLDQVARQNLWAQNVNLTLKPHDSVTTALAFHTFWLDKNRDALYGVAGRPVRRSPGGDVGDLLGNELDFTLTWQIDPHASLLFGYSHMWTSSHFFTRRNGDAEDPDLWYLQYRYQF